MLLFFSSEIEEMFVRKGVQAYLHPHIASDAMPQKGLYLQNPLYKKPYQ